MGATKLQSLGLDQIFNTYWDFISQASHDPEYFYQKLPTNEFIKFVSLRNHKSRGSDVENRIRFKNNWEKRNRNQESGDAVDTNKKNVEIKSSIITPNKGSEITLRGFRPWEEVDYYVIVILDVSNYKKQLTHHIYSLPKSFITEANGFIPDNQNKNTRSQNNRVQIGINFKINDPTYLAWEQFRSLTINF